MRQPRIAVALSSLLALAAAGCGGGGSSGPAVPPPAGGAEAGLALPEEISALPPKADGGAPALRAAARSSLATAALPEDSDYERARTVKWVNEPALSQFEIFNTIFSALAQTRYADAENVGRGPYGAIVSWVEERGDGVSKRLVPWVVDSSIVEQDGRRVNRVKVWMDEQDEQGQARLVKVRLDVLEAPTRRADGSYADYGVWRLDAKFDEEGRSFFAASAARGEDGLSIVTLHEQEGPRDVRGVLRRSEGRGHGKVVFPDWASCDGSPACNPVLATVSYVYDADHVALRKNEGETVFKDRDDVVDLVHRYGLYDAATGADVSRGRSFGFPVRLADATGRERWGWYGAHQGRHQVFVDREAPPAGATVRRADRPRGEEGEAYTTSERLTGTLVKRTLAPADVQDVKGLVVETFVNERFQLRWEGGQWVRCLDPDPATFPPTCAPGSGPYPDLSPLYADPADRRRRVNLDTWDPARNQPVTLVYLPSGPAGAGLYVATRNLDPSIPPTSTGVPFTPAEGEQVWAHIGGPIYVSFDGAAWVEKRLVSFDEESWTPTFDPEGDRPFELELGREVYVNNRGGNYVVTRTGPSTYSARIELQSVANPLNAAAFVPAGTTFRPQWGDGASSFRFVTDPASPAHLKLVWETVGAAEAQGGAAPGDVVRQAQWGLVAWRGGASTGEQYNWDWPRDGEDWGSQQFLLDARGEYVLLDDPIRLAPVSLVSHGGVAKTLSLQFDGAWVNGLPDVFRELERSRFQLSADLAAKVVTIPAGTEVVDALDPARRYLFKPLQVNQLLATVPDPGTLDLAPALAIDLRTVPDFVEHGMGEKPDVPIAWSEGVPVR